MATVRRRALLAAFVVGSLALSACGGAESDGEAADEHDLVALRVSVVEVKVSVHADDIDRAEEALGLGKSGRVDGEIYFFDDGALSTYERGVVVRARVRKGEDDDATIKLRPVRPGQVPSAYRALEGFKCEGDRTGGKTVVSCSLERDVDAGEIRDVARGDRSVDRLLSREQESLPAVSGRGEVAWGSLRALGPIASAAWDTERDGLALSVERWSLPNGERFLEVSTRCAPGKAARTEAALLAIVDAVGARPSTEQETKTRRAVSFFSRR